MRTSTRTRADSLMRPRCRRMVTAKSQAQHSGLRWIVLRTVYSQCVLAPRSCRPSTWRCARVTLCCPLWSPLFLFIKCSSPFLCVDARSIGCGDRGCHRSCGKHSSVDRHKHQKLPARNPITVSCGPLESDKAGTCSHPLRRCVQAKLHG